MSPPESKNVNISLYVEQKDVPGGWKCLYFSICRAKRRSRRVKMQIFHYTCSKSDLRKVKVLIFQYTWSKKKFREGENVDISLYVL